MKPRLALVLMVLLTLTACAFQKPIPGTNYGREPLRVGQVIPGAMRQYLKDPDSARYMYRGQAVKGYANNGLLRGGEVAFIGWLVPFQVNAKNAYGAYTGYEDYVAYFRRGYDLETIKPGVIKRQVNFTPVD